MDTLITSSANSLYLIFTSDYSNQYRGFAANYMAVSPGNNVENKKIPWETFQNSIECK